LSDALRVGFAGLGRMGLPMARNILRAGFPLTVWNRTPERCAPVVEEGAVAVPDAASLGSADVVVTMLTDGAAAKAVVVESGLLDSLSPGAIVLEMSTIGPAAVRDLAMSGEDRGVHVLDAPVSGSITVAEAAQLFAMVGGDARAYDRATPVLDAMTKGHALLGASGAGAAMKLALNAMIAVTNESLAETLLLAERFGIERDRAYDVIAGGVLASPFVLYKRGAFLDPETEPVAFTTDLMRKDAELAAELATELDVRMPAFAGAASMLDDARRSGFGDADMASVIQVLAAEREANPRSTPATR
jgi:3-hydroxyisobutyrate dehydrogenase-like beta-hydroxyacid dehydrogenase